MALWYWRRLGSAEQWFGVMLWAIAAISVSGRLWTLSGHTNNLPFFHLYILVEGSFLLFLFRQLLGTSLHPWLWKTMIFGFVAFWLFNGIWGEGWLGYPAAVHALEALLVLSVAVSWFAKVLREKEVRNIQQTFAFWLCTGLLVFFSTNLLIFLFSTFIVAQSSIVFKTLWGLHAVLAILLYLIYSFALVCAVKTPK